MSAPPLPDDPRHDTTLFGRSDELYDLVHHLRQGRHVLLTGEKGIGKSRLMLEARWILSGRARRIEFAPSVMTHVREGPGVHVDPAEFRLIAIPGVAPLGECLRSVCAQLHRHGDLPVSTAEERDDWETVKKRLGQLGAARIQEAVAEGLAARRYAVFIDSLDRLSPSQQPFVEMLLGIAVVCAAVAHIGENPLLKKIWASFARMPLGMLPEEVCAAIVDHHLLHYPFHVADPALYKRELLKSSNGNPFHLKNLLWHGLRESFVDTREIRRLRRVEEGSYFNMGPVYIFSVALFTVYKIFSIGADNRELYIWFSTLGFVAYLVFRVFRNFFIFRPQKYPSSD